MDKLQVSPQIRQGSNSSVCTWWRMGYGLHTNTPTLLLFDRWSACFARTQCLCCTSKSVNLVREAQWAQGDGSEKHLFYIIVLSRITIIITIIVCTSLVINSCVINSCKPEIRKKTKLKEMKHSPSFLFSSTLSEAE